MAVVENRELEWMIEDTIMQIPIGFEVDNNHYYIYPVTLGRAYLISREREAMAYGLKEFLEESIPDEQKVDYRKSLCKIVAIQTFKTKEEIFDFAALKTRTDTLYRSLEDDDLCRLYDIIISSFDDATAFIKQSGLEQDKKAINKIAKYKQDEGNFSFCGRTPYGSIIGQACEKFGWTLDYVVWGISYTNLKMLLADAPLSVYLSKDERKRLKLSSNRSIIDANNPANIEKMRQILKG